MELPQLGSRGGIHLLQCAWDHFGRGPWPGGLGRQGPFCSFGGALLYPWPMGGPGAASGPGHGAPHARPGTRCSPSSRHRSTPFGGQRPTWPREDVSRVGTAREPHPDWVPGPKACGAGLRLSRAVQGPAGLVRPEPPPPAELGGGQWGYRWDEQVLRPWP